MYWLTISLALIHLSRPTQANTEIRNFAVTEAPFIDIPHASQWHVLNHEKSSNYFNITSAQNVSQFEQLECAEFAPLRSTDAGRACPHELWVVLDTDAPKWRGYSKFTLRASWPAHQPTDILMDIIDPIALTNSASVAKSVSSTTRNKYARLRFIHTGVLSPTHSSSDPSRYHVSVHLILEPLLLGVLPQSVVPVVVSILAILLCGFPLSRKISGYLHKLAGQAEAELRVLREKKS